MKKKLFLAIFFFTVFGGVVLAQSKIEQSVINARDQFSDIKNRSAELERMKSDSYKRPVSEKLPVKFPEIKEDFELIQKKNDEILRIIALQTPLNYEAVYKLVSEINSRAVRLKSNLFATGASEKKVAKNKQGNSEKKDIKTLFVVLDEYINRFVHSSIFQNKNLVNSKDSFKAQEDLEIIIKVSNEIKIKTKD